MGTNLYDNSMPIYIPLFFIFVFLLIPILNGLGLSSSYIADRSSEIAIRKAYGAGDRDIIGLVLVENIAMSVVGALLGLLISYPVVVKAFSLLFVGKSVTIPIDMIFSYKLYIILVVALLIFNLLSIYVPLRRISKLNISDIIKN